ncbi:MAG: XrtA/PEP-CTERM system amidotransferase [Pseudomonadota bacterium]
MCGIAGVFHLTTRKPVDPARVERMCNAIAHRGPDGAGVWTAPGVGLGHRRLSVIDPQGSPQPMASADGRAMLVFNGEIYNYRALRAELVAGGVEFRTAGDSEVILAAWQRWGVDCLPRLHGMFAFALYDLTQRTLLLARDRLGIKPLFHAALSDGSLIFGSELKALCAHPLLRREADPLAVEDYLAWGYVPDARSILAGANKLAAGHYLLLRHGAPAPPSVRWWDVSFADRATANAADLEAELVHLLRQAVTSRMEADVPLGAFLSGGVDSSTVVALMAEASRSPVKTCSIGFDAETLDESGHATAVAARFGTDHRCRRVSPDDFDQIDSLAAMFDEPFGDASALPTWRVCQLARERVTVALSSDGADEAFAGYQRHRFQRSEDRVRALVPQAIRQPLFGALGSVYPRADWAPQVLRAGTTFRSLAGSSEDGYARALAVMAPEDRDWLTTAHFRALLGGYRAEQPLTERMRQAPARSGLDRAQYADLTFWLPGDGLTKVDRASMAVGLEAREPLLDHRLVEFAARLPEGLRIRSGQGKWLMKQAVRRYLPDQIRLRPEQGFVTPIAAWLRGPLAGAARAAAGGRVLARTGWFDAARLRLLADAHIAGHADNSRVLWQLIMLERSLERLGIA